MGRARLVLVVLTMAAATLPAAAAVGSVAGIVTDDTGAPANEVCVDAYPRALIPVIPAGVGSLGRTMTAIDGRYRIDGLMPGVYTIRFGECVVPGYPFGELLHDRYYPQWFEGADTEQDAAPVLIAGTPVEANAVMISRTPIAGRVTDQDGAPVAGLCVEVVYERFGWSSTSTEADGTWSFRPWEDGSYTVGFSTCGQDPRTNVYRPEWWNDAPTHEEADEIAFEKGRVVEGIDATVVRTGSISGHVDARVCAEVFTLAGERVVELSVYEEYVVGGLETGDYKVRFRDCHVGGYADEWYPDAASFAEAGIVHVEFGADTGGIDASLAPAGEITGRVTDSDGNPVRLCVTAWDPAGYPYVGTATIEDGTYRLPWMQPRGVKVSFDDCGEGTYEWWDDEASFEAAEVVPVTSGAVTTEIDAVIDGVPEHVVAATPRRLFAQG